MTAIDLYQALPEGYVWCIAGCAVGVHNGRDCIDRGGIGFTPAPQTPDGRSGPPTSRPSGLTPGAVECQWFPSTAPGTQRNEGI